MSKKRFLLSAIIGIALIIGTGRIAMAQTPEFPVLYGYFVNIHGQPVGPHGTAALRQLIMQGTLTVNSFVWREGMPTWVLAGTVPELAPLFAAAPPPLPQPPPIAWGQQPAPQPAHAGFQDFTMSQRWGTFWLNMVIPGLGSFAIMQDTAGGFVNLGLGLGAYVGYILYSSTRRYVWDTWNWTLQLQHYPIFWIAGLGFHLGQIIHNAIRSFNFSRPLPPAMAFIFDNDALESGLVFGKNGIEGVSFTFTFRY